MKKTHTILFFIILVIIMLSAIAIYVFPSKDKLEEKSTTVYQNLNQVQVIGTRVGQATSDFGVIPTEGKPVR